MDEKAWKARRRHLAMVMRVTEEEVDVLIGLGVIRREDDDLDAALRIDRHRRASVRIAALFTELHMQAHQPESPDEAALRHKRSMLIHSLADRRRQLGLSQEELAERIGATPGVVAAMEIYLASPGDETLKQYAKAVGTPLPSLR